MTFPDTDDQLPSTEAAWQQVTWEEHHKDEKLTVFLNSWLERDELEKQASLEWEQHTVLQFMQRGIFAYWCIDKSEKRKKFDATRVRALFLMKPYS